MASSSASDVNDGRAKLKPGRPEDGASLPGASVVVGVVAVVGAVVALAAGPQAAMISELPLGGNAISHNFIIEGRPPLTVGEEPELFSRTVAGDYFH